MKLKRVIDALLNIAAGIGLFAGAAVLVQRHVLQSSTVASTRVVEWTDAVTAASELSGVSALAAGVDRSRTVTIFGDYQCPACKAFEPIAARLAAQDDVLVRYRHFPLPQHRRAVAAAVAAECARDAGKFSEMHALLFGAQQALDTISFSRLAEQIPIPSITNFEECLTSRAVQARVEADRALALRLQLMGTPTIMVGTEVMLGRVPTQAEIEAKLAQSFP